MLIIGLFIELVLFKNLVFIGNKGLFGIGRKDDLDFCLVNIIDYKWEINRIVLDFFLKEVEKKSLIKFIEC